MPVTIELPTEVEQRLREEAARSGLEVAEFARQAVLEKLGRPPVEAGEAELLRQINEGLSPEEWQRYRLLITRRQEEALLPGEQAELIAFSDRLERLSARRAQLLADLARLRSQPVTRVMEELGLGPLAYG